MRRSHTSVPLRSLTERVSCWLLCGCVIIAPLAFGAADTWGRTSLYAAVTVAVALWAISSSSSVWLMVMPMSVCAVILFQLLPLPDRLLIMIAPVSAGTWKVSHEGLSNAWGSISVDPAATGAGIRAVFINLATLGAVAGLARYQSLRRPLTAALALSCITIVAMGLIFGSGYTSQTVLGFRNFTGPFVPLHNPKLAPAQTAGVGLAESVQVVGRRYQADSGGFGGGCGSYIYCNHYAGAVVLTLPILVAGLLATTQAKLAGVFRLIAALVVILVATWTVFATADSRAGTASLVIGIAALIGLLSDRPWIRRVVIVGLLGSCILAVLAVLLVLWPADSLVALLPEPIRKATVTMLSDARTVSAQVAMRMFTASPLLGTGLDTYQDIFPRFYRDRYVLFYAHNDYAQLMAETGLVGLGMAMALVGLLILRFNRFNREAKGTYRILNAGPWAGLIGIAVHSAFDWNLHLPANAFLASVVVGLAASSAPPDRNFVDEMLTRLGKKAPSIMLKSAFVFACLIVMLLLLRDAFSERAQRLLREAIVADRLHSQDPSYPTAAHLLESAIETGSDAIKRDLQNTKLMILVGQSKLHLARYIENANKHDAILSEADKLFLSAKQACPACRGLPEPVPNRDSR